MQNKGHLEAKEPQLARCDAQAAGVKTSGELGVERNYGDRDRASMRVGKGRICCSPRMRSFK